MYRGLYSVPISCPVLTVSALISSGGAVISVSVFAAFLRYSPVIRPIRYLCLLPICSALKTPGVFALINAARAACAVSRSLWLFHETAAVMLPGRFL